MTALVVAPVLAHQGGWDEMLFVLVPISVFAWLLSLANKRATREQSEQAEAREQAEQHDSPTSDDEPG